MKDSSEKSKWERLILGPQSFPNEPSTAPALLRLCGENEDLNNSTPETGVEFSRGLERAEVSTRRAGDFGADRSEREESKLLDVASQCQTCRERGLEFHPTFNPQVRAEASGLSGRALSPFTGTVRGRELFYYPQRSEEMRAVPSKKNRNNVALG
ncbi:hypothetical protein RRG08_038069 [Elysia crispata]|uniref:Uncharacterized protein n=1 Tax=Elysia crispata TaxID=231223 RepID=A0AAE0ZYI6_9GAST|nr:hypothetical protein RRG08_038069 [Elysia crispata]